MLYITSRSWSDQTGLFTLATFIVQATWTAAYFLLIISTALYTQDTIDSLACISLLKNSETMSNFCPFCCDIKEQESIPLSGEVRLAPANRCWNAARDEAVKLRMSESGPGSEPPLTIHQMFQQTVDKFGDHSALCYKKDGAWVTLNYKEYQQQCRAAAKSFLKVRTSCDAEWVTFKCRKNRSVE